MTKTKKFSFIIFGFLFVLANFLFVGCGKPDYSKTNLVCSDAQGQVVSVDLEINEEKYLDFTIINPASNMSNELDFDFKDTIVSVSEFSKQGYSTKYKICGLKGGAGVLRVYTLDGNIPVEVEINVKKSVTSLSETTEKLFITENTTLSPASNHFDWGEGVKEKSLKYYFYGEKNGADKLDETSLKFNEEDVEYSNEFKSVSIVSKNSKEYLLFTHDNGKKYSLSSTPEVDFTNGNKHYKFVEIANELTDNFANCKSVSAGESFYFVAVYNADNNEGQSVISCEREFTVLKNISVSPTVSYAYQQVNLTTSGEDINENFIDYIYDKQIIFDNNWSGNKSLSLVPSFTSEQEIGKSYEDYKVAYLKITTKTNKLMKVDMSAENSSLLSGRLLGSISNDASDTTDYYIELSSSSAKNSQTFYKVKFYYEGFKQNSSSAVDFTLTIPVEINIIPERLLVNDQNTTITGVYTFYNYYKEEIYGWQEFKFAIDPSDADFSSIKIDLSKSSDLQFKYDGQTYSAQSLVGGNIEEADGVKYLVVKDITKTVYIKGVLGATATATKSLNLNLCFNVFGEDRMNPFAINYQIVDGATKIELNNRYGDTIYIDVNENGEVDASGVLYSDAKFAEIYFYPLSGTDVASFVVQKDACGKNNELKFSILDKDIVGEGTYTIRLDNGVSKTIKIIAVEALKKISLITNNLGNNLVDSEITEDGRAYYVLNDVESSVDKLDLKVVANNNISSKAITNFKVEKVDEGQNYVDLLMNQAQRTFDIVLSGANGAEDIDVIVDGYKIVNFAIAEETLKYKVHLVSFDYIQKLNIVKSVESGDDSARGQEATNCNVYYKTQNENLRTVTFAVSVKNDDGYLFYSLKEGSDSPSWIEDNFKREYISWEYNKNLYYANGTTQIIETNYGYFNIKTLTYVAKQNIENANSVIDTILARVTQYGKTYSYTINIRFSKYEEVSNITLATGVSKIGISQLKKEASVVAFADNSKVANNPTLITYFQNNQIKIDGESFEMFEVSVIESDNKFMFKIKANSEFAKKASNIKKEMKARLYIIAQDWMVDGIPRPDKIGQEIAIDIQYENGTEENRYTLTSTQDFENFDLNAHYKLGTSIDVSSVIGLFPFEQEFSGSIVGTNEYAEITGIKFTESNIKTIESKNICGLFSSIGENAYIDNVNFSGAININGTGDPRKNLVVGLVAGVNKGSLRNIAVELTSSSVKAFSGDIGGVVGENQGTISQDYSFVSLSNIGVSPIKSFKNLVYINKYEVIGYDKIDNGEKSWGVINFGAVAGKNNKGTINKVDAKEDQSFIGYANYFVYANLIATKNKTESTESTIYSASQFNVGGVAGFNDGTIVGQVASKDSSNETVIFNTYKDFSTTYKDLNEEEVKFKAGKGLVVGGQIVANGYEGTNQNFGYESEEFNGDCIGGIAGKTNTDIGQCFSGLTSRMFIRGDGNIAGIANSTKASEGWRAFALQAIKNGESGQNASMMVIDRTCLELRDFETITIIYDEIMLGEGTSTDFLKLEDLNKEAFKTFVQDESIYDYLILGKINAENNQQAIKYIKFTFDSDAISIKYNIENDTLNNEMSKDSFYAYYFEISSVAEGIEDLSAIQNQIDELFNKISTGHDFYPIKTSGELTLTSLNPEILTFDRNGKMTIKSTGIAKVSATNILNVGNSLVIYIYVVNYFNSTLDESIVYLMQSNESTKIENTEITLIANNIVDLYLIPDYSLNKEDVLSLDKNGKGLLNNVQISLKSCEDVTAAVNVDVKNSVDVEIVGNNIRISKGENIQDESYTLSISPILKFTKDGKDYSAHVNKTLENVTATYKKGAISITNELMDEVSFYSSALIKDTIVLRTTANTDEGIDYKILDKNGRDVEELFEVSIISLLSTDTNNDILKYSVEISVNTGSQLFKDRKENNIYQQYKFIFSAKTNNQVNFTLPVTLERTNVRTIVVDNYNSDDSTTTSDLVVAGNKGHLEISLAPIDGDFDYILIENDELNYLIGHASAIFGISAKNNEGKFEDNQIVGSLTNRGIKLTREEIETLYDGEKYEKFNGSIYLNYVFASSNAVDGSISNVIVTPFKDGEAEIVVKKPLTVKLPYYVRLSIENKEKDNDAYPVARGLEYKLNVETYGYDKNLITIKSENDDLGTIVYRNGEYYLQVTKSVVVSGSQFRVVLTTHDEELTQKTEEINIRVQDFVVNKIDDNKDIVSGMGDGIINVQIGSTLKFELDLYDYIEFNSEDTSITTKVNSFMDNLVKNGKWTAKTNLDNSGLTPIKGTCDEEGGYEKELMNNGIENNYYFKYSNYKLTPIKTHEPQQKGYKITYTGQYKYSNNVYTSETSKQNDLITLKTEFYLNVYTSSSDQSPIPIFEYKDLLKMTDGGYYILLNNIYIPNEETIDEITGEVIPAFSPITTRFASLDGNGLSLIFKEGEYDFGGVTSLAPFTTLKEGSVIKNLTISYQSDYTNAELPANGIGTSYNFNPSLTYFKTSANNFIFGGIVAENLGSITNCRVETLNGGYLTIYAPNALTGSSSESYIGLIAGSNGGYITNSNVSVNVQAPFSIGGIVGMNDGKISGCAFKEGIITNVLSKTGAVAGLAVFNGEDAQITTSFVRGKQSSSNVISSKFENGGVDDTSIISSPYSASGFVYQNKGLISDCYTDINLKGVASSDGGMGYKISGFVGQNSGQIRNSFSVSLLPGNRDSSSGFAETNKIENKVGTFANCYYLSDEKINVDLKRFKFEGVEELKLGDFDPSKGKFDEYAHKNIMSGESVWFYPNGSTSSDFVEYKVSGNSSILNNEAVNGKVVFVGKVEKEYINFASGRLELVNPNIYAISRRIFDSSIVNEETGDITYYYIDEEDCPQRGSVHNPRLIYNPQTMEEEILSSTSRAGLNTSNYRLISDIDYGQYEGLSSLYTVTFAGILEGNGMTISSLKAESNKALVSAGLFASVGYSQMKRGSIKNLNLEIERMNFSETISVGGIAGNLKYGELHGITVKPSSSRGTTILGANFVGGIVGKATISYEITDVYSEMNASGTYISTNEKVYTQTTSDEDKYSYVGSVAGFLGNGTLYNARSANVNSIVGGKAGFVYGGLGRDAKVYYTFLDIKPEATIKSNQYAGLIAGETAGKLCYAYVSDNGSDSNIFDITARIPTAVGGISGRLAGGEISNAVIYQTLNVNNFNNNERYVKIVGGLVGVVEAESVSMSKIIDTLSTADVYSRELSAGAVGVVLTALTMDSVAIRAKTINVAGQTSIPVAGGLIGENFAVTRITNTYCLADIEIRTSTSGINTTAYASGFVAKNDGNLQMAYCYTISHIDAEVHDSREIGATKTFVENENKNISVSLELQTVTSNNVYYWGTKNESYTNNTKYISFKSKTKNAEIKLIINKYGTASNELKETYDNTDSMNLDGNNDIMKNLFINRYRHDVTSSNEKDYSVYYKKPDLEVKVNKETTRKLGFKSDKSTWIFDENNMSQVRKLNTDNTISASNSDISAFKQLKVYRDAKGNVYHEIKDESGFVKKDVFAGSSPSSTNLTEVWNYKTWDEFSSLLFETKLGWIEKTTIGKE